MPKAKKPRARYSLIAPSGKIARRGELIDVVGTQWKIIGWDDRKRYVIIERPALPGEQNLSETGLQMPLVVRTLTDQARFALGYRWQLITFL